MVLGLNTYSIDRIKWEKRVLCTVKRGLTWSDVVIQRVNVVQHLQSG